MALDAVYIPTDPVNMWGQTEERHMFNRNMTLLTLIGLILPLISSLPGTARAADDGKPVHICRNGAEYAPYVYWRRQDGAVDQSVIEGATTDFIAEVFRLAGLKYTQVLIPWKRCLNEVADFGANKKFEMFTDGSFSAKRAEKYFITAPIYKLTEGLWFSRKRFPEGDPVTAPEELNQYKLCGILGNNYSWVKEFGITKSIDDGAKTLPSLMKVVSAGRCDFFFNSLEPTYGGAKIGAYEIPEDIVGIPFPGGRKLTMHMFVSKTSPRAEGLYTALNQAILTLQYDGTAEEIYRKYVARGTGL